jgi:predicted O-methyltransferase YrrM
MVELGDLDDTGWFTLNSVRFRLFSDREVELEPDEFWLFKPPFLIERYLDLADEFVGARIFEVGVLWGGSTVFLNELLQPAKMVAIDLRTDENPKVDRYVRENGLDDRVRTILGVDQSDRETVTGIADREFGGEPLDLVIDDASHLLRESTATFEMLFPRLRPGGVYVLEDWSGSLRIQERMHRDDRFEEAIRTQPEALRSLLVNGWQQVVKQVAEDPTALESSVANQSDVVAEQLRVNERFREALAAHRPDLVERLLASHPDEAAEGDEVADDAGRDGEGSAGPSRFLSPLDGEAEAAQGRNRELWRLPVELMAIVALQPEVIESLEIHRGFAAIRRGPASLDPEKFRVADLSPMSRLL